MSDTLVSEEVRVSVSGVHEPEERRRMRTPMKRAKAALSQVDESLRLRPLPSIALALALGFVSARVAMTLASR